MAARKQQQEIEKEFKKVAEGVALFESIYDKLTQSNNSSQKDKLEDSLKKEIKKLQRSRDKIKGWASQNDIKDKKPLQDQRKLIETQMEKFKAVEKEMKTKAFSKEGLSAAAKLDPKEKEKIEVVQMLDDNIEKLNQEVEGFEAEIEVLQAGTKKSKKSGGNPTRMEELDRKVERHKFHVGKLEVIRRSLENDSLEVDQVKDIQEGIVYYVENNLEVDFMEDEGLYDELNLDEDEELYGMVNNDDKVSSQDAQSIQDEPPDTDISVPKTTKSKSAADVSTTVRRPSVQLKNPLPALSSLHAGLPNANGKAPETMKPAPLPTIPTGQPLKYASAAAAAAASDKNGVGIAPLPPPPGAVKSSETASPAVTAAQPAAASSPAQPAEPQPVNVPEQPPKQPTPTPKEDPKVSSPELAPSQTSKESSVKPSPQAPIAQLVQDSISSKVPQPPSPDSGIAGIALSTGESSQEDDEEECIYHLPSSLTDLLDSFEETKQRSESDQPFDMNMINASRLTCPVPMDSDKPNHYKPQNPYAYAPAHYPQEPLGIFDDPRVYGRIDTDSLFYAFYYRQGSHQQYLAAKALKSQSWRFHKQYQTWFQRHEEPKNITEEFEQGTYRFFDYESTWMNRRKAEFKFAYKFLEDDL